MCVWLTMTLKKQKQKQEWHTKWTLNTSLEKLIKFISRIMDIKILCDKHMEMIIVI